MGLKLISEPVDLAVSLEEALAHIRSDDADADATIVDLYLRAAIGFVDGNGGFLGRALVDQTWELWLDAFPDNEIQIPLPPLLEVVSIKYDNETGNETTLDPTTYDVDTVSEPGWVLPSDAWPATFDGINSARIRFRAGYLDMSGSPPIGRVPSDIKAAILMHVGSLYENRESIVQGTVLTTLPFSADILLRRKRIELSLA